jgi:hypothetical protein
MDDVSWLAITVRLPADQMRRSVAFWASVTGAALAPSTRDGVVELVPEDGAPFLAFEPTGPEGGVLEVEVGAGSSGGNEDLRCRAIDLGATARGAPDGTVVRTPGGAIIRLTHVPMGRDRR